MKDLNISKVILEKRKEKKITQDELANYIGVSKASVSKWETGQSYPDIVFLPQLAAYFNISIDELIGYSPDMTKEDIKNLYHKLASKFVSCPFDEVIRECNEIIKKYYSCFPLLLQMSILLINHYMRTSDINQQQLIIKQVIDLCKRIKNESNDIYLSKEAVSIEAVCYLILNEPIETLNLFDENIKPISNDADTIVQAYMLMGKTKKANQTLQISMYQNLLYLLNSSSQYLMLNINDIKKVEEIINRILKVADTFEVDKLNPNIMINIYITLAQVYCINKDIEKTFEMLQKYVKIVNNDLFPCVLHGDSYFDDIDKWFNDFDLGTLAPRNEQIIKDSLIKAITENPKFDNIKHLPKYKNIVSELQKILKVG